MASSGLTPASRSCSTCSTWTRAAMNQCAPSRGVCSNAWPWPAPCCTGPRCCCWTNPIAASTGKRLLFWTAFCAIWRKKELLFCLPLTTCRLPSAWRSVWRCWRPAAWQLPGGAANWPPGNFPISMIEPYGAHSLAANMPRASAYLAVVGAIVRKDLAVEWRSRQLLASMLVFALLVILIFNFALELDARARSELSSGVLWATFAFAGTLGLNHSMAIEKDGQAMDGLLLAPVDRSAIYFRKGVWKLLYMLIVALFTLPVYGVLYNVNLFNGGLFLVILLGAWGYSATGTLLAA